VKTVPQQPMCRCQPRKASPRGTAHNAGMATWMDVSKQSMNYNDQTTTNVRYALFCAMNYNDEQ
jgi:hypothetical protein